MKPNAPHTDLTIAQNDAYKDIGFTYSNLLLEPESKEYGACSFELACKKIHYRVAKITPTKLGLFVTFWKRNGTSPIMPYDLSDMFDLLIISVRGDKNFGQFIFPKKILAEQGLLSIHSNGGKRALRVYPPWSIPNNKQAAKTQDWQVPYFVEIEPIFNAAKMKALLL